MRYRSQLACLEHLVAELLNRVKEPGRKNPAEKDGTETAEFVAAVAIGMVLDVISAARSRRRRPESGSFLHPAGAAPDAI